METQNKQENSASWILELGGPGEVLNKYCWNYLISVFVHVMKGKYSGS